MKRIALYICVLLLVLSLTACAEPDAPGPETAAGTSGTAAAPTTAPDESPAPESTDPAEPTAPVTVVPDTTEEESTPPVTTEDESTAPETTEDDGFRDVTLLEDDLCRMTMYAVYRVANGEGENWVIWFELENRTDKYLYYDITEVCCFDCMLSAGMSELAEPGQTRAAELILESSELVPAGIAEVDELNFILSVYERPDPEAYYTEDYILLSAQKLSVCPTDKAPEDVTPPALPAGEDALQVIDAEACGYQILRAGPDGYDGYELLLYAENRSAEPLGFSLYEVCVNGIPVASFSYGDMTVLPERHAFLLMELNSGTLSRIGVSAEEITEFSAVLWVTDDAGEPLVQEPFVWAPVQEAPEAEGGQ